MLPSTSPPIRQYGPMLPPWMRALWMRVPVQTAKRLHECAAVDQYRTFARVDVDHRLDFRIVRDEAAFGRPGDGDAARFRHALLEPLTIIVFQSAGIAFDQIPRIVDQRTADRTLRQRVPPLGQPPGQIRPRESAQLVRGHGSIYDLFAEAGKRRMIRQKQLLARSEPASIDQEYQLLSGLLRIG
jgi:hypothetical protein